MIPVRPVDEPYGFDTRVRKPGSAWLKANPRAKRPRPLWNEFLPDLEVGFESLCGYAAMLDPTGGTTDHFLSFRNHPDLAYEWRNYRFASATMNATKRTADASVLDPYEVCAGWFEILLPSMQMRMTGAVPAALREKAQHTLERLSLRDGERIIRWRRCWYDVFLRGELTLEGLRRVAPLIAEAVQRASTFENT